MKVLNVSAISSSNAMPIKSGTLQFIQDAHKEALNGVITAFIEAPVTDTIYILSGCKNTAVLPAHNLTAGVLYVNGEIYNFDGASFTLTGLNKAYARIETTQFITNADPVQFTDGISRNVHNIRKIVIEATTVSSSLPEFKDFIKIAPSLKGDTKEVVCDSTYLANNFDGTGLGKLERLGWAIMNGNNGTPNDNGRVVIAYGSSYTILGATDGSKDAVVIEHSHTYKDTLLPQDTITIDYADSTEPISTGVNKAGCAGDNNNDTLYIKNRTTDLTGATGTDKNMQPYVVRLRIMKI